MQEGLDDLSLTWDDDVRIVLLNPIITPVAFIIRAISVNLILMWSQGGLAGMGEVLKAYVVTAEMMRQHQEQDGQLQQWRES